MNRPSPFSYNVQSGVRQKAGRPAPSQFYMSAKTPTAPPAYRPQPIPKVLQRKSNGVASPLPPSGQQRHRPTSVSPAPFPHQIVTAHQRDVVKRKSINLTSEIKLARTTVPPVCRAQRIHSVPQSKTNNSQPKATQDRIPQTLGKASHIGAHQATAQLFASRIVQATKFYPNLHPGAVESVDTSNIFKLDSFADQYRLRKVHSHGVNVPNQQYNFVRTREGEMLLHGRYRHPSIAEGKQVLYAGEIFFNNGKLQWWSNGSGHYQPYVEDAEQANLPMENFFSYQQIIKGEHTRKKG